MVSAETVAYLFKHKDTKAQRHEEMCLLLSFVFLFVSSCLCVFVFNFFHSLKKNISLHSPCLCLCFFVFNTVDGTNIDSVVKDNLGQANYPVEGNITITHGKNEVVDTSSFMLGDDPITPIFVKDMPLSNDQVVSVYSFSLQGAPPGLYLLPGVKVKVGDKVFQSVPSTYEIMGAGRNKASPTTQQIGKNTGPPTLRLEAKVKGPSILYPGERSTLFYRILYNRSIDLTDSNLPFVHPKEFQKIGDAHIKDYQETNYTVQEISQEIEAINPGTFDFGPASIAGYTYEIDQSGQKIYNPTPLQAVAPIVKLEVRPFPKENQPVSFNGSLGSLKAEIKMNSSKTINVGETINLTLTVTGLNNEKQMKLPELVCQPGFSGFFLPYDLPPAPGGKSGVAEFQIKLVALTDLVKEIPSIELSSFDTASGQYRVQKTPPIPLTVNPSEYITKTKSTKPKAEISEPDWNKVWNAPFKPPYPLELDQHMIPVSYQTLSWIQTSLAFLIIPFGLILLLTLKWVHDYIIAHPMPKKPKSEILFEKALNDKELSPTESLKMLEQAFWWRIYEKGLLKDLPNELEALPTDGWVGKVRSFILQLQSLQFSQNKQFILADIHTKARNLANEGYS